MRRAVVVAGLVAVVALVWALLPSRPEGRAGASSREPVSPAQPVARDDAAAAEPDVAAAESEEAHGTITGTLRYEDGAPATQRRISLGYDAPVAQVDANGTFRLDDMEPGTTYLELDRKIILRRFVLGPGEQRHFDHVIPRGAGVRGVIRTEGDQAPVSNCRLDLIGVGSKKTDEGGTFDFGWVPGGNHHLVIWCLAPPPDEERHEEAGGQDDGIAAAPFRAGQHMAAVVRDCTVGPEDLYLEIRVPRSTTFAVRFNNLPAEWREEIPFVLEWRDRHGLVLTLPPSNRIGWPGGRRSIALGRDGRAIESLPAPEPGEYTLSLVHASPLRGLPAWNTRAVTIGEGAPPELTIRLPDGARVTLVAPGKGTFTVGPVLEPSSESGVAIFPRVPAGRHGIWRIDRRTAVRVDEIVVPSSGEVEHILRKAGTASVRAQVEWIGEPGPVELQREGDDEPAARTPWGGEFAFESLDGGRYTLVAGERRIPVVLAEGQSLDLGVIH